jgi:hypothetical protein
LASARARVKVEAIIWSRGITIRQNRITRLIATIILNGFFTTFRI